MEYYDGCKLLSLMDVNGKKPEIYILDGNRTSGKTTYFLRLLIKKWIKKQEKFMILVRFKYELSSGEKFFAEVMRLFYPDHELKCKVNAQDHIGYYIFDGIPCGYIVDINAADKLKKNSHLFCDTSHMFLDEFQSEAGVYCPEETAKVHSLHMSVARGERKMVRYVPLYMCSNSVSLLNPYYTQFNLGCRINENTKFLRGNGLVFQRDINPDAAQAQLSSGFNQAFAGTSYMRYATEGIYLKGNGNISKKPKGSSKYLCTVKYDGKFFSVLYFNSPNCVYYAEGGDENFPILLTAGGYNEDCYNISRYPTIKTVLLSYHNQGISKFQTEKSKECSFKLLGTY